MEDNKKEVIKGTFISVIVAVVTAIITMIWTYLMSDKEKQEAVDVIITNLWPLLILIFSFIVFVIFIEKSKKQFPYKWKNEILNGIYFVIFIFFFVGIVLICNITVKLEWKIIAPLSFYFIFSLKNIIETKRCKGESCKKSQNIKSLIDLNLID